MTVLEIASWLQAVITISLIVAAGACIGQIVNRMSSYQRMLERNRRRQP